MALFGNGRNSGRDARSEMEEAAGHNRNRSAEFQEELRERTGDEKFAKTYRTRGRIYDKIPVSLRTMDIIIYVVVALIVIALVVGIITGN